MNKKLVIGIIITLIIIACVLIYIFIIKPKLNVPQPVLQPVLQPVPQPVSQPRNAVCLSNSTPPILDESYYTFDNKSVLGSNLMNTIKSTNTNVEYFALSGTVYADPSQLDPNKNYLVGTLVKTNILSPAEYGGLTCPEFPTNVYKLIS
jgi:hypothetical protein